MIGILLALATGAGMWVGLWFLLGPFVFAFVAVALVAAAVFWLERGAREPVDPPPLGHHRIGIDR